MKKGRLHRIGLIGILFAVAVTIAPTTFTADWKATRS